MMKNSISYAIHYETGKFIYKNNWPECRNLTMTPDLIKNQKYITTYSSCKVSPEGYVPQQIIIEYVPWLTYEEQIKKGYGVPEELRYAQGEAAAKKKIGYNGSTTGKNIKNPNYSMEKNCNYSP